MDLKCENKYPRDSKKIRKEGGMKTRLGRVDSCAGVFIPLSSPWKGQTRRGRMENMYIYIYRYKIKIREDDVRG